MSAKEAQVGGSHYKDMAIQPFEYITRNGIGFAEGSVIAYVSRWKAKNGVEDLKKARHFLDLLIEQAQDEKEADAILERGDKFLAGQECKPDYREQSPGWRFLEAGETIQDGDEFQSPVGWRPTLVNGRPVDKIYETHYRRRIASEKGGK